MIIILLIFFLKNFEFEANFNKELPKNPVPPIINSVFNFFLKILQQNYIYNLNALYLNQDKLQAKNYRS